MRFMNSRLGLLSFSHFTVDSYSSFFAPLLPLLVVKLDLSLTAVGTLVALSSLASSMAQPLFGLLADRVGRPWFVAFGPLVAAVFISCLGLAPDYRTLIALLMTGGLGVAAFHPQAAMLAGEVSPRRALAMAFFVTGGTLGFAIGPLVAVGVVGAFGLERSWVAGIPGIVVFLLLLAWLGRVQPVRRPPHERPRLTELRPVLGPLTSLYFSVVARSAVSYGFMTFLPFHLTQRGFSVAQAGGVVSLYLVCGAMGGFLGGWLADRAGGRRVMVASFVGGTPFYFLFLLLPIPLSLVCLVAGSFILQTSLPVAVVMGQELSPKHASTISSLLMGAAWGLGALIIGPIGAIADTHGLRTGLLVLATVLSVGIVSSLALPGLKVRAAPADLAQPASGVAGT
jgi:FSR family fosmidomycin resistance protein-like MFS transporter